MADSNIYIQIEDHEPKRVIKAGEGIGFWSPSKEMTKPGDVARSYLCQADSHFCILQGVTVEDDQIGERLLEGVWRDGCWGNMPNGDDFLLKLTGQL